MRLNKDFYIYLVGFLLINLTLSPGKAISGLDVIVIFAKACAALIFPTSVLSEASGIRACGAQQYK